MIDDRRHSRILLASCTAPVLPGGLHPGAVGSQGRSSQLTFGPVANVWQHHVSTNLLRLMIPRYYPLFGFGLRLECGLQFAGSSVMIPAL